MNKLLFTLAGAAACMLSATVSMADMATAMADRQKAIADYEAAVKNMEIDDATGFYLENPFIEKADTIIRYRGKDDKLVFGYLSFSGVKDGLHYLNEAGGHVAGNTAIKCFAKAVRETFTGDNCIMAYQGSSGVYILLRDFDMEMFRSRVATLKREWHDKPLKPTPKSPVFTNVALRVAGGKVPECGFNFKMLSRECRKLVNGSISADKGPYFYEELPKIGDCEAILKQETEYYEKQAADLAEKQLCTRASDFLYRIFPFMERARKKVSALEGHCYFVAMDGDHFSQVAREHGRDNLDITVRHMADIINRRFPKGENNLVCNPSERSDEFYMMLSGRNSDAETEKELNDLLNEFRAQTYVGSTGEVYKITCSIGAISVSDRNTDFEELFSDADKALYEAKNGGRDRLVLKKK